MCRESDFTGPFEPFHNFPTNKLAEFKIWGLNNCGNEFLY